MENQSPFDFSKLRANPFDSATEAAFPYLSSSFRDALAALYYGLEYGSRILLVAAGQGLGKTTLLRHFERRMYGRGHILFMSPRHGEGIEVPRKLLAETGGMQSSDDLHTMRAQIDEMLPGIARVGSPFILLLDYEDNTAESALEILLHLSSLESFEKGLLMVVIAASPDVAEKLQGSKFADDIRRVPLASLTAAEVESYIDYRLRLAGWKSGRLFTAKACSMIAQRSSANPLAINEICFNLLQNLAEQNGSYSVSEQTKDAILDESFVESVISSPKPDTPVPTYSAGRRMAALACIGLMLILPMAVLWHRSTAKGLAAKQVTAEIAVATDHKVIVSLSRVSVSKPTPVSLSVPQGATETHTVAARKVAVAPQGDSFAPTADELAAHEIWLGDEYMNVGDYDKALGSFSKAIALAPNNQEAEEKIKRARRAKAAEENILQ